MRFERIQTAEHPAFDRAFQLYEVSFPIHEQRTRGKQEEVLSHPEYHYEVIWEGDILVGILLFWEAEDFLYVEHFAIDPELRGQRFGSRALEALGGRGKPVVLEIDPPIDPVSLRRKHFYEKIGFCTNPWPHVHPPYRPGFDGHELVVMTFPAVWDRGKYERFRFYLRDTVMEDCREVDS